MEPRYIVPEKFTLNYLANTLEVSGVDRSGVIFPPTVYSLANALHCVATSELFTNRGKTAEVVLIIPPAGEPVVTASLDQLVNSHATGATTIKACGRLLYLGSGTSAVSIINSSGDSLRLTLSSGGLAGYLTLVNFLQRFLLQGISVEGPGFVAGKLDVNIADIRLTTLVDGKTFKIVVEKGLVTSVSS